MSLMTDLCFWTKLVQTTEIWPCFHSFEKQLWLASSFFQQCIVLGWLRSKLHCFIGLLGCSGWLLGSSGLLQGGFLLVKIKRVLCDVLDYDILLNSLYVAWVPPFFCPYYQFHLAHSEQGSNKWQPVWKLDALTRKLQGLLHSPTSWPLLHPSYHLAGENTRSKVRYTWTFNVFLLIR